jgi:hypothetical protein
MMKKIFLLLTAGLIFCLAHPRLAIAADVSFNPAAPSVVVGHNIDVTITVTESGVPATGWAWISSINKTSPAKNVYTAPGIDMVKPQLTNGQASLSTITLTEDGSYTMDVCVQTSAMTTCEPHSRALVFMVSAAPGGTTTTTSTPSTTSSAKAGVGISIPNPLGNCNTATCLITRIIKSILGIVAVIATIMFVWGGIMMLTSGGNERQVKQAKDTLVWAAIGLVIIIISWTLIKFVLESIIGAAT